MTPFSPTPTRSPRAPNRTKQVVGMSWAHGWTRTATPTAGEAQGFRRGPTRGGTSLLLGLVVIAVSVAAIVRVRASARVLGLGAEITELTDGQSRLQEHKRRLLAERAYLRHPDQIGDVARSKFGMVAAVPDLVQAIRLVDAPPAE